MSSHRHGNGNPGLLVPDGTFGVICGDKGCSSARRACCAGHCQDMLQRRSLHDRLAATALNVVIVYCDNCDRNPQLVLWPNRFAALLTSDSRAPVPYLPVVSFAGNER